jgi:hypothetical protein
MKRVFILTYCRKPELLYGTALIFKTLRVGFPTAEVQVVDNSSLPGLVRSVIRAWAEQAGCSYRQLDGPRATSHHLFLKRTILSDMGGTVIFLDPDVCFWENCENWSFTGLVAGRRIPCFYDEFARCVTMPRLHTSFLWVEDVARLRERIVELQRRHFDFDPFAPYMFPQGGRWHRFDACANLFAALEGEMHAFGEIELNAYDHLFCGSHLDQVLEMLDPADRTALRQLHSDVRKDYRTLQGAWRRQEEYFTKRRAELPVFAQG